MKVCQFMNKNQFEIRDNNKLYLQSYDSLVVEITNPFALNSKIVLGRDWDYSTTTSKHVYAFIDEYAYGDDTDGNHIRIELRNSNNKRKYIQKLIDNNIIKYDEEMY